LRLSNKLITNAKNITKLYDWCYFLSQKGFLLGKIIFPLIILLEFHDLLKFFMFLLLKDQICWVIFKKGLYIWVDFNIVKLFLVQSCLRVNWLLVFLVLFFIKIRFFYYLLCSELINFILRFHVYMLNFFLLNVFNMMKSAVSFLKRIKYFHIFFFVYLFTLLRFHELFKILSVFHLIMAKLYMLNKILLRFI